jgi:biopolymer transport protein ExbD
MNRNAFLIRVEQDAIFVDNKKIANAADIAKQDSLAVEALRKALESKKDTSKKCQIKIDSEQSYKVLYKTASACKLAGYTDVGLTSKINEEDYAQSFSLERLQDSLEKLRNAPKGPPPDPGPGSLSLHVVINENYFQIFALGGSLPKIFHNENLDSAYSELESLLIAIHNRFRDESPDADVGCIKDSGNIKISNVIPVMQRLKTAGFTEIDLSICNPDDFFDDVCE